MSYYKQDEPNEGDEVVITYGKLKDMEKEIERLKEAEQMLFQVMQSINFSKNVDHNLPDVFDNQLCDGIEDYFRRKHSDAAK